MDEFINFRKARWKLAFLVNFFMNGRAKMASESVMIKVYCFGLMVNKNMARTLRKS